MSALHVFITSHMGVLGELQGSQGHGGGVYVRTGGKFRLPPAVGLYLADGPATKGQVGSTSVL